MVFCLLFHSQHNISPINNLIIKGTADIEKIIDTITKLKISWFVIPNSPDPQYNFNELVESAKKNLKTTPEEVGWSYVWNTEYLWGNQIDSENSGI
jgi:hypothetical protein